MLWLPLKLPPWISRWPSRHLLYGILIGFSVSITSTSLAVYYNSRKKLRSAPNFTARPIELRSDEILSGVTGLIGMSHHTATLVDQQLTFLQSHHQGNTPLIRINSLSNALGVEILGKAEVGLILGIDQLS